MSTSAMLLDIGRCIGCETCTAACTLNRGAPVEEHMVLWTRIQGIETGHFPNVRADFAKLACNHCTEASCLNVCPSGAISRPDGVHVVIDQEWCIGCGYCATACPFGIPQLGEPKGSAQKCNFCYGTRTDDQPTACASACPTGAITFGERDALIQAGRVRVEQLRKKGMAHAYLYGERELGGLNVLYVLADHPSAYGLPVNPQVTTAHMGVNWLSGVVTAGVLAMIPFYALFKRKETLALEAQNEERKERAE